jgi:hypothetical protein
MFKFQRKNMKLLLKASTFVLIIIAIKLLMHFWGVEIISLNNLFSGIIAGNVFLMGFLLSGVLSDYKESERIPGEIANSLTSIFDEFLSLHSCKNEPLAYQGIKILNVLTEDIDKWFIRQLKTRELLLKFRNLNNFYFQLENVVQANHIVRLKNETSLLKRQIIRTDSIRDTDFISSGYLISSSVTGLLCCGLILSKIEPFVESLFFVGVISFLMIFLLLLIRDLDNPFAYDSKDSGENVSLYPIYRIKDEIGMALLNQPSPNEYKGIPENIN